MDENLCGKEYQVLFGEQIGSICDESVATDYCILATPYFSIMDPVKIYAFSIITLAILLAVLTWHLLSEKKKVHLIKTKQLNKVYVFIVFFMIMQFRRIYHFKTQWRWLKTHPEMLSSLEWERVPH